VNDGLQIARLPPGFEGRTYADGDGPITDRRRSIDCSTLATRPKASAARRIQRLPVGGIVEAAHELDGIGGGIDAVERRVERVEPFLGASWPHAVRDSRYHATY
jgi:hypothetical protein